MNGLAIVGAVFRLLGSSGFRLIRVNAWPLVALAALLTASWLILARRSQLIPITPDNPLFPFQDVLIVGATDFLKLLLIGTMVPPVLRVLTGEAGQARDDFLRLWGKISAALALAIVAVNILQLQIEFGGAAQLGPAPAITVKLGMLYVKLGLLFVAILFFTAAPRVLDGEGGAFWSFTAGRRAATLVAATLVYLISETLLTTLILYSPVIAPFWFGLNQLGGIWTALVQSVSVAAETVSVLVYACFFAVAYRDIAAMKKAGS